MDIGMMNLQINIKIELNFKIIYTEFIKLMLKGII